MRRIESSELLALWERGATRHPLDRAALLCSRARPDLQADAVTDLALGEVTLSLLKLRWATFGPRIRAHVDCAYCGERLDLDLQIPELMHPTPESAAGHVEGAGQILRVPSLRDLAAVAGETDVAQAARRLLGRCLGDESAAESLSEEAAREIERKLEDRDPNADIAFEVNCAACKQTLDVQLDAGDLLWEEIDIRARQLLGEVHVLARTYGWTEGEILALGPERRATYLAMVSA